MLQVLGTIAEMMAISFGVAMAVAFAIDRTTRIIEKMTLSTNKPDQVRRVKHIRKIAKKEKRRMSLAYEQQCKIEMINHYYGDDDSDGSLNNDLISHFYPNR